MQCRHCLHKLQHIFLDLGFAPPSNAYLEQSDLVKPESYYPLRVMVCEHCWLVQTQDYTDADALFDSKYAYFSSVSTGWLEHAKRYVSMISESLKLNRGSFVVELASNDGYLLKNFVEAGIPCLGVEPTASTAAAARDLGVPVIEDFFDVNLAKSLIKENGMADLIIGNNVFAHVPDINGFTAGMAMLLRAGGTITLEFPHLLRLLVSNQFDTVYHEHFSYLSLVAVRRIFSKAGLRVFNVEELSTHGGSLRVYGCHQDDARETQSSVARLVQMEQEAGLENIETYQGFQQRANRIKDDLLSYLIEQKRAGKKVVAYGAAAKGNTLINFAGIKSDLLEFVCDAAPSKQGRYLPGSHIPVYSPDVLKEAEPDVVLILPWNISEEVKNNVLELLRSPCEFVIAVPELKRL